MVSGFQMFSLASSPRMIWSPCVVQSCSSGLRSVQNVLQGCLVLSGCVWSWYCQCCWSTDKCPFSVLHGWYPATIHNMRLFFPRCVVQQNHPSPIGSCPDPAMQCMTLLQLNIMTLPGWYGFVLLSFLLWPIDRWMASHHPLICSGSHCAGGMRCHAMLFSIVRKISMFFCLSIVIWSGFLGYCSTEATLQSSGLPVILCLVALFGVDLPSWYRIGCC